MRGKFGTFKRGQPLTAVTLNQLEAAGATVVVGANGIRVHRQGNKLIIENTMFAANPAPQASSEPRWRPYGGS